MKILNQQDQHKKILANCTIKKTNDLYLVSLENNIDRETYNSIKKIFNKLDIKWNSQTKQHTSKEDPSEAITLYIDCGYLPPINPHAYFVTPSDTIKEAIEITNIPTDSSNLKFLEPSAGCGRIAELVRLAHPTMQIDCIEIDPKNRKILVEKGFNLVANNFERYKCDVLYNIIIMNPPFQGITYQKHIRKAWEMLVEGGLLTAIVPSEYRKHSSFRNWIFEFGNTTYIGNVFENTNIECEIVSLVKSTSPFLWQPVEGFGSSWHQEIQLFIDSDSSKSKKFNLASFKEIDVIIDKTITGEIDLYGNKVPRGEIKQGIDFLWNNITKTQVKEYLKENEENDENGE